MSGRWALRYLLDRRVLSSADAVLTTVEAEDTSISHASSCVYLNGRPQWFIKRADPARSQGRDLGSEAAVYRLAASDPSLAEVIPRCRLIDERGDVIVLDAVAGKPLTAGLQRSSDDGTAGPSEIVRAYGEAVARIHAVQPPPMGTPPWLLTALEPQWGNYSWLPPACASLLSRLAASATMRAAFQQAQFEWTPSSLVHGDLRWANVLMDEDAENVKLWLVDWELACLGDPAWDVGSILADIAATVLLEQGIPSLHEEPLSLSLSMLAGYRAASDFEIESWAWMLQRSVRLAGVRLVQTMIEQGHVSDDELQKAETRLMPWCVRFLTSAPAIAAELARAS